VSLLKTTMDFLKFVITKLKGGETVRGVVVRGLKKG
jgi:small nuclear ribonucleoprotein (snRNP)-like protein